MQNFLREIGSLHNWFRDKYFLKLIKNAQKLFGGDAVHHVFKLVAISLTARALGTELFGILVLIQTYTRIIDKFVNFQSWQGFIKYGAEYKDNDRESYLDAIRVCTHVDILSALLGTLLSCVALVFVSDLYNWSIGITFLAYIYTFKILFNLEGTPSGILRLYDKYNLYAYQRIITATVQLIIVGILFILGIESLTYYLIGWLLTEITQHLLLFYFGWRELSKRGIGFRCLFKIEFKESKDLLKFVGITNLQSSIKLGAKEFDTLLVGYIFGNQSVGLFDIAKKFSSVLEKISNPVYQVIYPDLATLWAKEDVKNFKKLIYKTGISLGFISILAWGVFYLFGHEIFNMTVGNSFIEAYPVLLWYMGGVVISIFTLPIHPAILSMNRPEISLYAITISTVIYLSCILLLATPYGLVGVGMAYIVFYLIWSVITLFFVARETHELNMK